MDNVMKMRSVFGQMRNRERNRGTKHIKQPTLTRAKMNTEYTIKMIQTDNREIQDFLFTLGCYEGEMITVISTLADHYVIVVKDARYSIDRDLADCIII